MGNIKLNYMSFSFGGSSIDIDIPELDDIAGDIAGGFGDLAGGLDDAFGSLGDFGSLGGFCNPFPLGGVGSYVEYVIANVIGGLFALGMLMMAMVALCGHKMGNKPRMINWEIKTVMSKYLGMGGMTAAFLGMWGLASCALVLCGFVDIDKSYVFGLGGGAIPDFGADLTGGLGDLADFGADLAGGFDFGGFRRLQFSSFGGSSFDIDIPELDDIAGDLADGLGDLAGGFDDAFAGIASFGPNPNSGILQVCCCTGLAMMFVLDMIDFHYKRATKGPAMGSLIGAMLVLGLYLWRFLRFTPTCPFNPSLGMIIGSGLCLIFYIVSVVCIMKNAKNLTAECEKVMKVREYCMANKDFAWKEGAEAPEGMSGMDAAPAK